MKTNIKKTIALLFLTVFCSQASAQISPNELALLRAYFVAIGNVNVTDIINGSITPPKFDRAYLELGEAQSAYATKTFVFDQDYATKNYVRGQDYATKNYVQSQDYATKSYVNGQGFSTESFVLNQGFVKADDIADSIEGQNLVSEEFIEQQNFATESFVTGRGYITEDDLPELTGITVTFTQTISSVDHVFEFESGLLKALTIDGISQPPPGP